MNRPVKKVIIAGGGSAGWIAAATLSSQIGRLIEITLVESDQIGTVGVGEATIPTHVSFHRLLGIDEKEFIRATNATFKLGISFENWGQLGDQYIHSFGKIGRSTWMGDFQHMWQHAQSLGFGGDMDSYCFELQAAKAGRFAKSDKSQINYAYHLDASLYAKFLREFSEKRGVKRVEGQIEKVNLDADSGFINGLSLTDGQSLTADFFIDCTGFRSLLLGDAMGVSFEDWSHWLPMNRALAVQTKPPLHTTDIAPFTRSIARKAGWQWRIPLQHRVGNGHVYCSDYLSDDEAHDLLMSNLDGEAVTDPRPIRFVTGKRKTVWEKNCLALGLSSGFLEPLESTSIHLAQIGITRLVQMFPFAGVNAALKSHYNKHSNEELESIRDFLIAHYKVNQRVDSDFWIDRAAMDIPDTLAHRIDLFRNSAIAYQDDKDLFRVDSWVQVLRGQGLQSHAYHHMGKLIDDDNLKKALAELQNSISGAVDAMPKHAEFLHQFGVKV